VKIPIFASFVGKNASSLLASGASGFVTSLMMISFVNYLMLGLQMMREHWILVNESNGLQSITEVVGGFVNLEDREKQLIEMERSVLNEAIEVCYEML